MANSLIIKKRGKLAWILLNRPEKLNALTDEMMEELEKALEMLNSEEIRVVIISGNGDSFSSGADLNMLMRLKRKEAEEKARRWKVILDKLESFPKPTIAAIRGYCLGCGLELALACDFRIASENAIFGQPEVNLGLIPGAGAPKRLIRLLGETKTKELIMLGGEIGSKEAEKIGLITKTVPEKSLEKEVEKMALKLAEKSPKALEKIKHVIKLISEGRSQKAEDLESKAFGELIEDEEFRKKLTELLPKS